MILLLSGGLLFGTGGYWCVMYHLPDSIGIPMLTAGFIMICEAAGGLQEEYDRWMLARRHGRSFAEKTSPRTIFYWDMDGVLAIFKKEASPEDTMRPGYFFRCAPDPVAIMSLSMMVFLGFFMGFENRILSCAWQNGCAERDKTLWLWKYGLGLVPRIFVPCGEEKTDYIEIDADTICVLVDDRSANLFPWDAKGLVGCKYYNKINGTGGTWKTYGGYSVSCRMKPWQIAARLIEIIDEQKEGLQAAA